MAKVVETHPVVLWLDAGCVVRGPLLPVWAYLVDEGIVSPVSSGKVKRYTHEGMRAFYSDIGNWARMLDMRSYQYNGALIGVYRNSPEYTRIFLPWLRCALEPACIAPPGSSRENHRQDQAALSVLMYANDKMWLYPSTVPVEYHHDIGGPPKGRLLPPVTVSKPGPALLSAPRPAEPVPIDLYTRHLPTAVSLVWLPSPRCATGNTTVSSASSHLAAEATVAAAADMLTSFLNPTVLFVLSEDAQVASAGAAELRSIAGARKVASTRVSLIGLSATSAALTQGRSRMGEYAGCGPSTSLDALAVQLMATASHWSPFASTHYLWLAPGAHRVLGSAQGDGYQYTLPNTISRLYSLLHVQGLLVLVHGLGQAARSSGGLPSAWAASKRGLQWLQEVWQGRGSTHSLTAILQHHPGICMQAAFNASVQGMKTGTLLVENLLICISLLSPPPPLPRVVA